VSDLLIYNLSSHQLNCSHVLFTKQPKSENPMRTYKSKLANLFWDVIHVVVEVQPLLSTEALALHFCPVFVFLSW